MSFDKKYLVWALAYVVVGMCLGIFMAASHDHGQLVAHAHINLVGFLLSFCYGLIHKLWLGQPNQRLASIQFYLHQAATVVMFVGLFLLYGKFVPGERLDPILGLASIAVLLSALLMFSLVLKAKVAKT